MKTDNLRDVEDMLDWCENVGIAASVTHRPPHWLIQTTGSRPRRPSYLGPIIVVAIIVAAITLACI